jgi:hypothetical protein
MLWPQVMTCPSCELPSCPALLCGLLMVNRVYLPPHSRAGESDVLIDGLPGTPDGISRWVGGVAAAARFASPAGVISRL